MRPPRSSAMLGSAGRNGNGQHRRMQFRAQSARGLGRTGLDDVPGYGSVSGSGLIARSTGQRTSGRCSPVVRRHGVAGKRRRRCVASRLPTVSTALQRFDANSPEEDRDEDRQLTLEDCCGSILDQRMDQIRRGEVISIVAPAMALGVRMLRAPAAGRCLDDFRRRESSDRRLATVAADAPWPPKATTRHRLSRSRLNE